MALTVYLDHHWGGHCRRTGHRTVLETLFVVITAQVPLHIYICNTAAPLNVRILFVHNYE